MDRENLAKAIFTHVKNNDNGQVEKCLNRGDVNSWREIIRYEIELLPLLDNVLKDNKLAYNLIQCTINSLSPLHLAALLGHHDILVTFLDKDIPVDTASQTGTTCLHLASFGGHVRTVKLLLDVYHADSTRQDKYGWTALHYASIEGNLDLIKQLVQHGVDIAVRDKDGTCAALRAKWRGHEHVVSYFCRLGEEDELLNIDEDILNQNAEEPPYATIKQAEKQKSRDAKQKSKDKKENKTSVDKSLLEQNIPSPMRLNSLPTGSGSSPSKSKRASGGGASSAWKSQTLPVRFKEARLSRIRRVIRNELEAAFSDYEQPIGAAGPVYGNTPADEDTEIIMAGVGVQTMTKLMRQEIQKYKDTVMSPARDSRASPISEVDNDVYEDHYQTLDQFGYAPQPPGGASQSEQADVYKSFVPPPLPPRNKGYLKDDRSGAWDMTALAETLKVPGQPTDMALNESIKKLSQVLGGNWKRLARALPLAPESNFVEARIREMEKTYLGNVEKQAMVMLIEWRMNKAKAADVDALIIALRKCGMKDKIKEVERITQEFTA